MLVNCFLSILFATSIPRNNTGTNSKSVRIPKMRAMALGACMPAKRSSVITYAPSHTQCPRVNCCQKPFVLLKTRNTIIKTAKRISFHRLSTLLIVGRKSALLPRKRDESHVFKNACHGSNVSNTRSKKNPKDFFILILNLEFRTC